MPSKQDAISDAPSAEDAESDADLLTQQPSTSQLSPAFSETSSSINSPLAAPVRKRFRSARASDDVSKALLESIGMVKERLTRAAGDEPTSSGDESDNFGKMVACQHRMLTPQQKVVFMNKVAAAFNL